MWGICWEMLVCVLSKCIFVRIYVFIVVIFRLFEYDVFDDIFVNY